MGHKCGRQVGDKCKLSPKNPEWETSVGNKSGRQVWETSVKSCGPRHPEWETSVGDKWKTSVNSCGPRHPEWETSVGDKGETSVGDKCKLMWHKANRVGDKCGRQV